MPLFSRRRASSQPPRPLPPPSSSAMVAASNAFMKNSPSTASLSSAAAAAALRSHTTSPEPIGNIQTKRMMRRGSQSSLASNNVTGRPGAGRGMVRQNSSSSMTERTFRSPSPGRYSAPPAAYDAPPVPAIPTSARRSASVEPRSMRESMRVASPTPGARGRNVSVDTGRGAGRTAPTPAELGRGDSQRSVNFSRPMSPGPSPGPTNPPPARARPQSASGYYASPSHTAALKASFGTSKAPAAVPPPSQASLSSMQARQVERDIQSAANKPVVKKQKKVISADEGDRLANGTMHAAAPTRTAAKSSSANAAANLATATTSPTAQTTPRPTNGEATQITPMKKTRKVETAPITTAVDNEPPPKNPARYTFPAGHNDTSPISPRAAGVLQKQPSMVREDPEAENLAEQGIMSETTQSPTRSASVANNSRRVVSTSEGPAKLYTPRGGKRSASLDIPRDQRNHAHFSDVIVVNTPASRHQPPPRSVSPFKSALKHSPASSLRDHSPAAMNGSVAPGSDVSDTTSLISQDGIKAGKKKKSARVMFDDGGTTVSPPAPVVTPNSSKPIRRELSPMAADDGEIDETMAPRPALPLFGSVRTRGPEAAEKDASPATTSSNGSSVTTPSGTTSDHALGALVANDFATKQSDSSAPLPPQVTSKEASGYESESSEDAHDGHTNGSTIPVSLPDVAKSGKGLSAPSSETNNNEIYPPDISVQPATPLPEEDKPTFDVPGALVKRDSYNMPGGWESEESKSESARQAQAETILTEEPDFESSEEEEMLDAPTTQVLGHSPNLEPIYESDSDKSEDFSDANEEFEGEFASLDAVLATPRATTTNAFRAGSTPFASPATSKSMPALQQPVFQPSPLPTNEPPSSSSNNSEGDWTQATAYWSSLTRERKIEMERQAQAEGKTITVVEAQQPKSKKRLSQAPAPVAMPTAVSMSSLTPASSSDVPETRVPTFKKTMRGSGDAPVSAAAPPRTETHMKKSMRSGDGNGNVSGQMKTSMRQDPPRQTAAAPAEPRGALQKRRIPTTASAPVLSAALTAAAVSPAAKKPTPASARAPVPMSNDSDSESSFRKKKRRGSVSTIDTAGRYNMKRSMRGSSVEPATERRPVSPTPAPRTTSSRLSIRSLSPNGSFMGRNRGENLRASLRGEPVDDTPTMRGKNSKALRSSKSPSRFSMSSLTSKPRDRASSVGAAPPSRAPPSRAPARTYNSRFVDSDDEDDTPPRRGFRSRFNDSDDEDSPVARPASRSDLAPVRGIPRSADRYDDSTDLEDSDDEQRARSGPISARQSTKPGVPSAAEIDAAMEAARRNVTAMNGGRPPGVAPEAANGQSQKAEPQLNGSNVDLSSPATPSKRRGLLGSMLGRRRTSSVASVPQIPSSYAAQSPPQSPVAASPVAGKLQRRGTARMNSNMSAMTTSSRVSAAADTAAPSKPEWPLPPNGRADENSRLATSDGADVSHLRKSMRGGNTLAPPSRPDYKRRSMSGGDIERLRKQEEEAGAIYSEKTGKKKRFSMLRRAFGLHD